MKKSNVIGIDLAKNVIRVCIISQDGELLSNKAVSPNKLKELLANKKSSIVAMEGCSAYFLLTFLFQLMHLSA